MARLALVGGHSILDSSFAGDAQRFDVDGAGLWELEDGTVVLQRHGIDAFVRADQLDHHRNLAALAAAGCDRVLALGSSGSLRADLPVGSVVAVDDFYAPQVTATSLEGRAAHQVHAVHGPWRRCVLQTWRAATATPIVDGGTYAQTTGPRFETPAEVRALATVADVVGMTLASEIIAASELGLAYAALAVVDNLGNGLEADALTADGFFQQLADNTPRLLADLDAVLPVLTQEEGPWED
jgi:5'-methylthioadenosine phosphorylase